MPCGVRFAHRKVKNGNSVMVNSVNNEIISHFKKGTKTINVQFVFFPPEKCIHNSGIYINIFPTRMVFQSNSRTFFMGK